MSNNENKIIDREDSYFSTVRTRNAIEGDFVYDTYPEIVSVPPSLKQTFPTLINKPFFIDSYNWSTAKAQFTELLTLNVPSGVQVNDVVKTPFTVAALYRTRMCMYLQVTGTPQHQGTLLVAAMPFNSISLSSTTTARNAINSMLQAPHVFLSANESTPVCLEIPFYSNIKLRPCDVEDDQWTPTINSDYASLYIVVLNPLLAPTSGSTSLSVSVHAVFKEAEFYVPANNKLTWLAESKEKDIVPPIPMEELERRLSKCERDLKLIKCCTFSRSLVSCLCCCASTTYCAEARVITNIFDGVAQLAKNATGDFIDYARSALRTYTGFHNPNIPMIQQRVIHSQRNFTNSVDVPTYQEKLDPYANHDRIVNDATFYTTKDEMLLSNILEKPQYISTFSLSTTGDSSTVGHIAFSRPITPFQEKLASTSVDTATFSTPFQVLGMMSRYWSGTIKLHIQSVMSNFHFCKLMVVRNYTPDINALLNTPNMDDITNLQTTTLEFSGGGQVQTVDLQYCSFLDEMPLMNVAQANALSHGMYYIYLVQPLVANGSVATTVNFNVYISAGEDFNFYGYAVERLIPINLVPAISAQAEAQATIQKMKRKYGRKLGRLKFTEHMVAVGPSQVAARKKESDADANKDKDRPASSSGGVIGKPEQDKTFKAEASVIVDPSSQNDLTNSADNSCSAPRVRKFQPIVSVRDHIRRYMTCPTQVLSALAVEHGYFIHIFKVEDLLKLRLSNTTARSGFSRVLRSFYMGATGGVKFKFKVSNCSDAQVTYYPPQVKMTGITATSWWGQSTLASSDNTVRLVQYAANQYPNVARTSASDYATAPKIETAHNVIPYVTMPPAEFSLETITLNNIMLECVIPQMNPFEFVGDSTISTNLDTDTYANDYGTIVISYFPYTSTGGLPPNLTPTVTPMIAYPDEARFGFNVFSPPYTPDYSGTKWTGPYQSSDTTAYTLEWATTAPKCYIG